MKSDCDGLGEIQARLLRLERQNLRFKRLGFIGLLGITVLIVLGQAPARKSVEANEFIQRDNSGKVRARTTMNALGDPEMMLCVHLLEVHGNAKYDARHGDIKDGTTTAVVYVEISIAGCQAPVRLDSIAK